MSALQAKFDALREEIPYGDRSTTRCYFLAGAAAMAEQFAEGQGTMAMLIRELAEIQNRNAQQLLEEIRNLRKVQAEAAGLNHWAEGGP